MFYQHVKPESDAGLKVTSKCVLCRVVRYRSLQQEFEGSSSKGTLRQALTAEDTATNASLYILLRAADHFNSNHHRFPGLYDQ